MAVKYPTLSCNLVRSSLEVLQMRVSRNLQFSQTEVDFHRDSQRHNSEPGTNTCQISSSCSNHEYTETIQQKYLVADTEKTIRLLLCCHLIFSTPGTFQNLTRHGPGQSAPADPALSRKIGLDHLQRSLPM